MATGNRPTPMPTANQKVVTRTSAVEATAASKSTPSAVNNTTAVISVLPNPPGSMLAAPTIMLNENTKIAVSALTSAPK